MIPEQLIYHIQYIKFRLFEEFLCIQTLYRIAEGSRKRSYRSKRSGVIEMQSEDRNYYVYVILSKTPTGFGKMIRKFGRIEYNHASIAFDKELKEMYSFGRKQHQVPIVAGFVMEYPERFSLKTNYQVNAMIYRIPVTRSQYILGKERIQQIANDDEYLYNLFSVLLFPFVHGFSTFKAYTCAEFVVHVLKYMNITLKDDKMCCQYTPEEIGEIFQQYLYFKGNLLDYCSTNSTSCEYFFQSPSYLRATLSSLHIIGRLLYRKLWYRKIIYW